MANEIRLPYEVASATDIYAVIRNPATLVVWDGTGMVAWVDANIANYKVSLADKGGDYYTADAPANLGAGTYRLFFYDQAGATPAIGDALVTTSDFVYDPTAPASVNQSALFAGKSRLDTVNEIIGSIGLFPVVTLDTGGGSDAAFAETLVDRWNKRVQQQKWHCNTINNVTLSKELDGTIPLSTDMMRVDADERREHAHLNVCRRGNNLFDLDNNTFVFTQDIVATIVYELPFDDLTPSLKDLVCAEATVDFQRSRFGSDKLDRYTQQKLLDAKAEAMREENDIGDHNMLSGRTAREIMGLGLYTSVSRGNFS